MCHLQLRARCGQYVVPPHHFPAQSRALTQVAAPVLGSAPSYTVACVLLVNTPRFVSFSGYCRLLQGVTCPLPGGSSGIASLLPWAAAWPC